MKGSDDTAFKHALKTLILEETEQELGVDELTDTEALFGPDARLALQVAYGIRITDPKELMRVMRDVNTLADHLRPA